MELSRCHMVKNLSHADWVRQQFDKRRLRSEYRNVLIHSSIIEGTLRNKSGRRTFDMANRRLLCSGKITSCEFCIFNEIRTIRNRLVHDSFKDGLVQNQIDGLRDELMRKILQAYRISVFLNDALFARYALARLPAIVFEPVSK